MTRERYRAGERICREGQDANRFFIILSGEVTCWRRDRHPDRLEHAAEPPNTEDVKRRASVVAQRRGSIPGPRGEGHRDITNRISAPNLKGIHESTPYYHPSVWCCVEMCLKGTIDDLKGCARQISSGGPNETPGVQAVIVKLDSLVVQLRMWHENGMKRLTSDLDDLRECEELLEGGMDCVELLREVLHLADQLQKEQLMLKFYLQLRTFKTDSAAKLRAPHGPAEASAFLTVAEEGGYALAHCDTQLRVKRVTPSFAALSGYNEEECVGMPWKMLQGPFFHCCVVPLGKRTGA